MVAVTIRVSYRCVVNKEVHHALGDHAVSTSFPSCVSVDADDYDILFQIAAIIVFNLNVSHCISADLLTQNLGSSPKTAHLR